MSMGTQLVWLAILGSLAMAFAAAAVFVFAVKRDYFRNLEETKYQVFWSDCDEDSSQDGDQDDHKR